MNNSPNNLLSIVKPLLFKSVRELRNTPKESTGYIVEDLLPRSGLSILAGKPKMGKSTLARQLAVAIAQGKPFLGRRTEKGTVLYMALEEKPSEVCDHFRDLAFGNFFWPISGGLIWPTLGRCRLGKAFALPSRKNKDRRRSCGNVGIPLLLRDFQGRWEEWETVLGFSTLSTARHFHS